MLPRMTNLAAIYYYNYSLLGPSYATEFGGGISGQNNQVIAHTYNQMDTNPGYTARICNAILIRFRERYVGDKIRRRWIPPKLFGVQNVVYRRRVRLQYVSNAPQYPIRPQFVGVIVLNGFYCSSNYLQSDRHAIYIEAIVVIFPVVFEHCCAHTYHTDEQQKLHASDMLQEQDELCLSSKAEDNRSC